MTGITRLSLALLLAVAAAAAAKQYDGYGLYRVSNSTLVYKVAAVIPGIDWWSRPYHSDQPGDLMVPKSMRRYFEELLTSKRLHYQLLANDVQTLIDAETRSQRAASRKGRSQGVMQFDRYYRHAAMNAYLEDVAATHPNVATLINVGKTFEGRDMMAIKLSTGSGKRAVFVDAGIHAREWIAPATALYLLQELTEGSATDLVNDVDWIILPSVNPDGYEYTHEQDRLWRKTRSVDPSETCVGVDANRNFDFHWMDSGSSSYPCSETFAGKVPFSEVEAKNLRKLVLEHAQNADAYITLHSYGQYLLYPWGYSDDLPDDWRDLDKLGNEMNAAIKAVRGTTFTVGSSGGVLYAASGASDDWAKGVAGIKYVYTVELPGGGNYGFDLPASEIMSVVTETLEGLKVVGRQVAKKHTNGLKKDLESVVFVDN